MGQSGLEWARVGPGGLDRLPDQRLGVRARPGPGDGQRRQSVDRLGREGVGARSEELRPALHALLARRARIASGQPTRQRATCLYDDAVGGARQGEAESGRIGEALRRAQRRQVEHELVERVPLVQHEAGQRRRVAPGWG